MMIKVIALILSLTALSAPRIADAQEIEVTASAINFQLKTAKVSRIYGTIDENSWSTFEADTMTTIGLPGDRIILINSPGGLVNFGEKMIELVEFEKRQHVRVACVILHGASSMAFNLLTHCDIRLALPKAHALAHKLAYAPGLDCANIRCTAEYLRGRAEDLDKEDEKYRHDNAKALHISLSDYDLFAKEERIWSAADLCKAGYLAGTAQVQNVP